MTSDSFQALWVILVPCALVALVITMMLQELHDTRLQQHREDIRTALIATRNERNKALENLHTLAMAMNGAERIDKAASIFSAVHSARANAAIHIVSGYARWSGAEGRWVFDRMVLPPITETDRGLLHDNPNTDDVVAWVMSYARSAVLADRAQAVQAALEA